NVQAKMESSFGADFSNVNIHVGEQASSVGALAYAQGNDIHFAPGQYNPETQSGQELLGHELTHVVQQRQGRVQATTQAKGLAVNDDPALEHEADVMGKKAAGGEEVDHSHSLSKGSSIVTQLSTDPENITYSVSLEGDAIKVKIGEGSETTANTKQINGNNCRTWMIGNYNWNGIVKILKYASSELNNFNYSIPTDLEGTDGDNTKIIPIEGIKAIIELQAKKATENSGSNANITSILSKIDGLPGNGFATGVMGETSRIDLMDESGNTNINDHEGNTIEVPSMNADPATLYDFFRNITLARNGLWSDNENIVNITGLRRVIDAASSTQYNDTLAACWISNEEGEAVKHCTTYSGTTEPGNRNNKRQLQPQTMLVKLGYHQSRQPGGRTHQTLIKGAGVNNNERTFNSNDAAGMNFHHGGNSVNIGDMDNVLPGGTVSSENSFLQNIKFVEIFHILSKWGLKNTTPAYQILKDWHNYKEILVEGVEGDNLNLQREGDEGSVQRNISTSTEWLANYWINIKKDRNSLLTILQSVDSNFVVPENFSSLNKDEVKELISSVHIEEIFKKQTEYYKDLNDIDGKAGADFIKIIEGKKTSVEELVSLAQEHYPRIESLFSSMNSNYATYLKGLKMNTSQERNLISDNNQTDVLTDDALQINQNVGSWSEGCQVIFGPEQFYNYWMDVTNKAEESGQRKWYYTLIDMSSLETEVNTESGEN
ncbi:MAG: DUF4157 domain-containing protein, partial [Cytophagaceae bacterium]